MENSNRPQSTFSKISSFFHGNSNVNRKLSTWKQDGEQEEWASKAVDVLVKKLKKQPGAIQNLEVALQSRSSTSNCVIIPRSIDGRLQVEIGTKQNKTKPCFILCPILIDIQLL